VSTYALEAVTPPNLKTETRVFYYEYMASFSERHFGAVPSRSTMLNWARDGYPVARGGPYIEVPIQTVLKRPMTTKQAMSRFLTVVRKHERELADD